MKIRLVQFLCYEDTTFAFGEEGLTLISGHSGVGKSSILRGIFFALFGEGNKVQSYGKISCRVELDFEDLKIIRTKRPNRLVVNDIYEDAAAQEIINQKFGITFKTSGYIQQNNLSSFILMNPLDKLSFLENFAFRDIDLGKMKGRCKAHITTLNEELVSTTAQLTLSNNVLNEMTKPELVIFPLKSSIKNREISIKNEEIRLKNTISHINKTAVIINKLDIELNDINILSSKIYNTNDNLSVINTKLEDVNKQLNNIIYKGDDNLEELKQRLNRLLLQKNIILLKNKYKEDTLKLSLMKEKELLYLNKELEKIDIDLWKEYTKEDLEETLQDLKSCLKDSQKISNIQKNMSKYEVKEELIVQNKEELIIKKDLLLKYQDTYRKLQIKQELYKCPCCSSYLRILNDKLCLVDYSEDDDTTDLEKLYNDIQFLKENIKKIEIFLTKQEYNLNITKDYQLELDEINSKYETPLNSNEINEDIEYLKSYKNTQKELEQKKITLSENIKNETFSLSYTSFKKDISILYEKIEEIGIEEIDIENIDEEELRTEINQELQVKNKKEYLVKLSKELIQEKNNNLDMIQVINNQHIQVYKKIRTKDILIKILNKNKKIIETFKQKQIIYEKNLEQIEKWRQYKNDLDKYNNWIKKIKMLELKEKEDRKNYAGALLLKQKILEAESKSMLNIIDTINVHARIYLDYFFPDNPISVQLQPFKHTKKETKPSINLLIEYKGMECDLNMLSGGELSRVVLSYTLALAEIFNTPLLLLDECTASLDEEMTNTVFEGIREHFNGKLVLIIAHQVIAGTFDNIINL